MGIVKQLNKTIYYKKDQTQIDDLQNQFDNIFKEILKLQDNPTSQIYHQLYNELLKLLTKIEILLFGIQIDGADLIVNP